MDTTRWEMVEKYNQTSGSLELLNNNPDRKILFFFWFWSWLDGRVMYEWDRPDFSYRPIDWRSGFSEIPMPHWNDRVPLTLSGVWGCFERGYLRSSQGFFCAKRYSIVIYLAPSLFRPGNTARGLHAMIASWFLFRDKYVKSSGKFSYVILINYILIYFNQSLF